MAAAPAPLLRYDFTTPYDGLGQGVNEINLNNWYRKRELPLRGTAKKRQQVMVKQGPRVIHAQQSKNIMEERELMKKNGARTLAKHVPVQDYYPQSSTQQGVRAPVGTISSHQIKTGNLLFEVIDPIKGESQRTQAQGASSLFISNVYNNLPYWAEVRFVGIAQGEPDITNASDVRTELTVAVFGGEKILNNSGLTIPAHVYVYMSTQPYITTENEETVNALELADPYGMQNDAFIPGIFYLTDNSIFSLETRIGHMVTDILSSVDTTHFDVRGDAHAGDYPTILHPQYITVINDIATRRSTTFEMRKDFVLYEMATFKGVLSIMDRIDRWTYGLIANTATRMAYKTNLALVTSLGARALSFFGRERTDIVSYHLSGLIGQGQASSQVYGLLESDFFRTPESLKNELTEIQKHAGMGTNPEDTETDITWLLNKRHWLRKHIDDCLGMCRSEGTKLMKRLYVGKSRQSALPGEHFDIEILA
jgi:hypothetical protein